MQSAFYALSDALVADLTGDEVLLTSFSGESSDFVRLNHGKVRQAGSVEQRVFTLQLVVGQRHASASLVLSGDAEADRARGREALAEVRQQIPLLPEDPHLLYATDVVSDESIGADTLPDSASAIAEVVDAADGLDLVGIWAAGAVHRGFANSLGQRNWFTTHSFHLDWSVYHRADKATKQGYAGTAWDGDELRRRMAQARVELDVLKRPAKRVEPGEYRVYLAPAAVEEIAGLLCWGGFGMKNQKSKRSPLQRLVDGQETVDPRVTLSEHPGAGLGPQCGAGGFARPARVGLVTEGRHAGSLVSPRSAQEFGVPTNGANGSETPESLEMEGGALSRDDVLSELGTGVWVNNLWYLNYSDLPACRMTGMTRFATLWVEDGEIVAPLDVMRFDDSFYRMFGDGLVALTRERELLLSASTYSQRSTVSALLPGALIDGFRFTL